MKAYVIHKFGDPSVFKEEEIPKPEIKPGHVLIKVHATSVNPVDFKVRSGLISDIAPEFPATLHGDVAGTIEEIGEGVEGFDLGDEVYGCAGGIRGCEGGALAEFLLADAHLLAKKPKTLSFEEAAALPLVVLTAWIGLFTKANLQAEQHVLIHAGLGGVGHIAVQLAKWKGAHVYATVSSDSSFDKVKSLGADHAINYKTESVADYVAHLTGTSGFEVIFDTVGGDNLDRSFEACALNGDIVTTLALTSHNLSPLHAKGLSFHVVFMLIPMLYGVDRKGHGEILKKVADLVDQGKLKPLIHETLPLHEVSKAHAMLEKGGVQGKIVLSIP